MLRDPCLPLHKAELKVILMSFAWNDVRVTVQKVEMTKDSDERITDQFSFSPLIRWVAHLKGYVC